MTQDPGTLQRDQRWSGIPPQVFVFGSAIFAVGILCALASIVVARKQT